MSASYQYDPSMMYGHGASFLPQSVPPVKKATEKEDPILAMLLNRGKAETAGDVGAGIMGFGNSLRSDAMGARNQDIETGSNGVSNIQAMLQQLESTYKNRQAMNQRMAGISAMGGR